MASEKLVSIIVPVYNAEKYIDKCINSILDQTYKSIELILVNDGSTDKSEQICIKYAKKDSRIVYAKQSNAGPSASRNNGISRSKGDYIQFLDADDYLDKHSVEILVKAIKDVDYVIASYYNISESNQEESKKVVRSSLIGSYKKEDLLPHWGGLVEEEVFHYTWNKLYRSEFIKEDIRFNEDIKISEDMLFNLDYLSNIKTLKIIDEPIYYHVLYNQDSLTKKYHSGLFEMRKITHTYILEFLKKNDVYTGNNCRIVNELYAKRIKTIFIHLSSKKTQMKNSLKLNIINHIVNDDSVQSIVQSFDSRLDSKLTAYLIAKKRTKSILFFYFFIGITLSLRTNIRDRNR